MIVEVAIATMSPSRSSLSAIHSEPVEGVRYTVIEQVVAGHPTRRGASELGHLNGRDDVRWLSFEELGLASSRNRALKEASGDILLLTDDDVALNLRGLARIRRIFVQQPDIDILTAQIHTPQGLLYKPYRAYSFVHGRRSILQVSSAEIVLRVSSIRRASLRYDERFGLGARFPSGEEAVFLSDAHRSGLRIVYFPLVLSYHPFASSGKVFSLDSAVARGAVFGRLFGMLGYFASVVFVWKKRRFFSGRKVLFAYLKDCWIGVRTFRSG